MTTLTQTKRRVPAHALRFAADVGMDVSAENEIAEGDALNQPAPPPPKDITIRARTTGIAYQGYWGRCVHDMAGFIPPAGPVPLDWNHSEDTDIGVALSYTIDDQGLLVPSRLIPFTSQDRAAQIIYKGAQGVPYQASIVLSLENLIVTDVPEGAVFNVNGQDWEGPLTVFSQWSIDGISVLPYGADADTSVQFSRGENVDVDVTVQTVPVPPKEPIVTDLVPNNTPPALPPEALTFSRDEMAKWMQHFGRDSLNWYLDGTAKTFEEAALLFGRNLQTKVTELEGQLAEKDTTIAALTTERDDLKKKTEFRRGHQNPVNVDKPKGDETETPQANPQNFGRTEGMSKFVASIARRLPGASASK